MQVIEHSEAGLTFEGLIDALLVLYEECGHDKIKSKNEVVASFLAKFQSMVHNYNKLRVNINDFQVKRVIGRGKFGEVKLVKEKSSGAVYALKVMKKTGESSSAFFSDERDIMARNSSPWLTKLDYAFQDGTYLYLAMEFHCGETSSVSWRGWTTTWTRTTFAFTLLRLPWESTTSTRWDSYTETSSRRTS